MKKSNFLVKTVLSLGIAALAACSTMKGEKSSEEVAASGPTVIDVRTNPSTFELNEKLQPTQTAEVFADVKDFKNEVTTVKMRFVHIPMEVPMKKVAGTTWKATLTPEQLKQLAVTGQTMRYDVNIVAVNNKGQAAMSQEPITVAIKAPDQTRIAS